MAYAEPKVKPTTRSYKNPDALEPEQEWVAEIIVNGRKHNRLGKTRDEAWRKLAQYLASKIPAED